jgi:predicted molibdopterin-dependent oxidoreductase YjgC
VVALRGESVATAALAAGITITRNAPVKGDPRAPYCLMGVCFECLMTIDGLPNRQACLVPVQEGMVVELQGERPSLSVASQGVGNDG